MFYNERYWTNKADRAIKAREHTRRMDIEFGEYIKDSVAATKIYGGTISDEPVVPITETVYKTEHVLADLDSVLAVLKLSGPNICVHNFASYRNPGGRFIDGSKAQEECLCHGSFLYNVLNQFLGYYAWNEQTLCRGFYTNRALYSPHIIFFGDNGVQKFCDVLTCAAPNFGYVTKYGNVDFNSVTKKNCEILESRILFIKKVLEENNCGCFITGAFGCGVFRQDATTVAKLFKEIFDQSSTVQRVIYAVPRSIDLDNYAAFESVFKKEDF